MKITVTINLGYKKYEELLDQVLNKRNKRNKLRLNLS